MSAGWLLPAGSGSVGAAGPHGLQGDCGSQPPAVHRGLHHPGPGGPALPARLPGLLRGHPGEQMPAALCEFSPDAPYQHHPLGKHFITPFE